MASTMHDGPARVELELLARAAIAAASLPRERGRDRAARVTGRLVTVLAGLAGTISTYDVGLLLSGG